MAVPVPKSAQFGRRTHTRQMLVMAGVFVLYLVLGGIVFSVLEEHERELTERQLAPAWQALQVLLDETGANNSMPTADIRWEALSVAAADSCCLHSVAAAHLGELLEEVRNANTTLLKALEFCGTPGYVTTTSHTYVPWSFIDAAFFCMTVITTIGYGHISPATPGGQIFCIFYSLLGIPISGLMLAGLSEFFAGNLLNFYDSKWQKRHGDSRWSLAGFTALYLLVGFLMFVFAPAIVFCWLEGWTYLQSVYYAFTTLSTIGFGDFTAAVAQDDAWTSVYKLFVMLWVLIGLGYWVLVLTFLQKALKSKEVTQTLQQTSKLIAREAEELRNALADHGLLHRDAVFVPERSKNAMSMMMNMSTLLAAGGGANSTAADDTGAAANGGYHAVGASLRSNSLLNALLASMPAAGLQLEPAQTQAHTGEQAQALLDEQQVQMESLLPSSDADVAASPSV